VSLSLDARLKLERLRSRTADVVSIMTEAAKTNLSRMGVGFIQGEGRLGEARGPLKTVVVRTPEGERTLQASVVLIATARGRTIPKYSLHGSHRLRLRKNIGNSTAAQRLIVVGGGAIGCEYASIFTALGVEVTLLELGDRLLSFMTREMLRISA